MPTRQHTAPIPTKDGYYIVIYDDGSFVKFDQGFNVVEQDDTPNPQRAALVASGDEETAAAYQAASDENARRWNADFGLRRQQARSQNRYQDAQAQNIADRLAFDRENAAADRAQRESEFARTFGLNQARLGYDLIGTAANLRGPSNYFQASNYARGVAAQPGTSTFLSALQNNTRLADFGRQAGAPDAETLGSLTAKLGGGGANPGGAATGTDDSYLRQIHAIAARGGGQLGAGQWEQLTPTEQKAFLSGLEAPDELGKAYDADTFLSQWARSRIGQGIGGSSYRAA